MTARTVRTAEIVAPAPNGPLLSTARTACATWMGSDESFADESFAWEVRAGVAHRPGCSQGPRPLSMTGGLAGPYATITDGSLDASVMELDAVLGVRRCHACCPFDMGDAVSALSRAAALVDQLATVDLDPLGEVETSVALWYLSESLESEVFDLGPAAVDTFATVVEQIFSAADKLPPLTQPALAGFVHWVPQLLDVSLPLAHCEALHGSTPPVPEFLDVRSLDCQQLAVIAGVQMTQPFVARLLRSAASETTPIVSTATFHGPRLGSRGVPFATLVPVAVMHAALSCSDDYLDYVLFDVMETTTTEEVTGEVLAVVAALHADGMPADTALEVAVSL